MEKKSWKMGIKKPYLERKKVMYNNKTFLAIIPARGGSKRLPKKNILDLNGKPLIAYSIEAGLTSKYIDHVSVSSDSEEVLSISKKFGAQVVKRPSELADDKATTYDSIVHAIEKSKRHDYIVLLQPTSPLRNAQDIDEAIELLSHRNADAVISVCEAEHSPLWSNILPENGDMKNFLRDEVKNKRSQDLERYYRVNGAIYICKTDRLLAEKTFFIKDKCIAYKMDRESSVDIDDKIDFALAEILVVSNSQSTMRIGK
jgi:CMP-N,N'-diacetyllegionaminic acid synthase